MFKLCCTSILSQTNYGAWGSDHKPN